MRQIKARHFWKEKENASSAGHPVPDSAAEPSFLHISSSDLLAVFGSMKGSYCKNVRGIVNKLEFLSSLAILGSSQYKINYSHSKSRTAGLLFLLLNLMATRYQQKKTKARAAAFHISIIQIICSLLYYIRGGAVFRISTNANLINPLNRNKQQYQDFPVNIHHWNLFLTIQKITLRRILFVQWPVWGTRRQQHDGVYVKGR